MNDELVAAEIHEHLHGISIGALDVFATIESTNTYLMNATAPEVGSVNVAVAAHQTAGRGSNNRDWLSSPDGSLCLSVAYSLDGAPPDLPCLTLATGTAVVKALRSNGFAQLGIKWPNDIVDDAGKVAGILIECRQRGNSPPTVVIGIGLNIALDDTIKVAAARGAHSPVSDLRNSCATKLTRSELAGVIIRATCNALIDFERQGFAIFHAHWKQYDRLYRRTVNVDVPEAENVSGVCEGITAQGALIVSTAGGRREIMSGSVRVMQDERVAS